MNNTTTILDDGTLIRVTGKSVSGDPEMDSGAADVGDELTVYEYAPGEDGDDPNGRPYYLLDTEYSIGGSCWAYPDDVAVVKSAQELANRRPPSLGDVRDAVALALMGMHEPIDVHEADYSGAGGIDAYGRTDDGLRVAFRVRVDRIEETDF